MRRNPSQGFKLFGKTKGGVKYTSKNTRGSSLQGFMGGAEFTEKNNGLEKLPIDNPENLEAKFNSGVNRTDMPSSWSYPSVDYKLADRRLGLAEAIQGWRRNKGEPV